jgi:hypoxanthine-DNA glycosylase
MKKEGFPPIIDKNTKILVLGTMPGDMSLRTGEYYANPRNQFWKLIFSIFNSGQTFYSYKEKVELLQKNKIGLWDVLANAQREGSLDSNIGNKEFNDFYTLFMTYPNINKLIFNGQKSADYFKAKNSLIQEKEYLVLPSTSSANTTRTFEFKLKEWKVALTKFSS